MQRAGIAHIIAHAGFKRFAAIKAFNVTHGGAIFGVLRGDERGIGDPAFRQLVRIVTTQRIQRIVDVSGGRQRFVFYVCNVGLIGGIDCRRIGNRVFSLSIYASDQAEAD